MRVASLVLALMFPLLAAGAQDPVDRFETVNGLRIHYVDWGNAGARPVVLLHGIGRVARTFDPVAARMSGEYHLIAIDMRGHGDSDWDPSAAYRVEDYVTDVEGLVARLGLSDIVIWGNSTGGRVAQVYAGLHPERVAALIVEDVGPERPRSIADSLAGRIQREDAGWASKADLLAELTASNPRTSQAVLGAYAEFGSRRREDGRIVWKRDPEISRGFVPTDLWDFVRRIRAPVIYVLGGRSTIVPASTQEELRRAIPQVEIVTMQGLGHYPSEEDMDGFLEIVETFLSRLD